MAVREEVHGTAVDLWVNGHMKEMGGGRKSGQEGRGRTDVTVASRHPQTA